MRTRKPPRSRERYILDSIPKIFKGGEWMTSSTLSKDDGMTTQSLSEGGEGVSASRNGTSPEESTSTRYITVIGGQKYDEGAVAENLNDLRADERIICVGAGRGVESDLGSSEYLEVFRIPVDPDLYGKNARKVNVECVLSFAPESPLLLVGEGERVKQARAWLKRARWPREVVELP